MNRSFQLKLCSLRREYLQTCQQAVTTLHLLTSSVVNHSLKSSSNSALSSNIAFVPLPSDERALYQCSDQLNQLAHQYTLLRARIAVQESTANQTSSSSTSNFNSGNGVANGGGAENTTSFSIVTGESSHSVPKFSSDQQSDAAVEILQTMCLVLAYSFQKLAKVLSRTAFNGDGQQQADNDEDEEIFDIDPLLIPLLYHQDQEEVDADGLGSGSSVFGAGGPRTLAEVFRASTRKALGYVDQHLQGGRTDTLEASTQCISNALNQTIRDQFTFQLDTDPVLVLPFHYCKNRCHCRWCSN